MIIAKANAVLFGVRIKLLPFQILRFPTILAFDITYIFRIYVSFSEDYRFAALTLNDLIRIIPTKDELIVSFFAPR